jgi:hypothetical protein
MTKVAESLMAIDISSEAPERMMRPPTAVDVSAAGTGSRNEVNSASRPKSEIREVKS